MVSMGNGEHFMCTDVEWDPSGRFVASSVSYYRHHMETGFMIWTFQGKQLQAMSRDKFYQFAWRPRPPSLLTEAQMKNIHKTLKEWSQIYDQQQKKHQQLQQEQMQKEKQQKKSDFIKFLKQMREQMKDQTKERRACRKNCDWHSDDESVYIVKEDWVEEVIE